MLSAARLVQYAIETNRGPSSNTDGTVNYAEYGAMHRQALADAEVLESALKHQQEELEVSATRTQTHKRLRPLDLYSPRASLFDDANLSAFTEGRATFVSVGKSLECSLSLPY